MKQKTVPWDEATLTELKMFAAQVLGMSTHPSIGESTLRGKIRQAYNGQEITIMVNESGPEDEAVGDAPSPPSETPNDGKALRGASAAGDPKVKITIAEVEGAGGKRPVPVGVNGVIMLVPRGKAVDIPYRYYEALTHAVKTTYEQDEASGEVISSDVPSYPMSVNVMPPQAEIDAYLAAEQQPEPQAA
jgi:hypothetical protein